MSVEWIITRNLRSRFIHLSSSSFSSFLLLHRSLKFNTHSLFSSLCTTAISISYVCPAFHCIYVHMSRHMNKIERLHAAEICSSETFNILQSATLYHQNYSTESRADVESEKEKRKGGRDEDQIQNHCSSLWKSGTDGKMASHFSLFYIDKNCSCSI